MRGAKIGLKREILTVLFLCSIGKHAPFIDFDGADLTPVATDTEPAYEGFQGTGFTTYSLLGRQRQHSNRKQLNMYLGYQNKCLYNPY